MEPSDEVRELRRLRDAVECAGREAGSLAWMGLPLVMVLAVAAWGIIRGVDALDRIADCQCHDAAMEAE